MAGERDKVGRLHPVDVGLHGYALDALAIPYMKDKSAIEIANRGYWCGTPVIRYSMDHEAPSEEFLKARAKILEENIKSGTNFWVATGH